MFVKVSGVTRSKLGQLHFVDFWPQTFRRIEKKNVYYCHDTFSIIDNDLSRNINETYIFTMKSKVQHLILPESVVQFFTPLYHLLTRIITRNMP